MVGPVTAEEMCAERSDCHLHACPSMLTWSCRHHPKPGVSLWKPMPSFGEGSGRKRWEQTKVAPFHGSLTELNTACPRGYSLSTPSWPVSLATLRDIFTSLDLVSRYQFNLLEYLFSHIIMSSLRVCCCIRNSFVFEDIVTLLNTAIMVLCVILGRF